MPKQPMGACPFTLATEYRNTEDALDLRHFLGEARRTNTSRSRPLALRKALLRLFLDSASVMAWERFSKSQLFYGLSVHSQ